jgi:4-aminobutyrate aminotransferase/(S)-3-amino-2-methylpropionate transaminase
MVAPYPNAVELAERLAAAVPIADAKAMFVSTGAEAVENAIKIARVRTGRPGVIAFSGSFHGRTNLCMGLTGKIVPYKKGFGPFTPEIYHAPFPAAYLGVSAADSLAALEDLFKNDIEPDRVAAIIIEPVQGEGGFYPAPDGFLGEVRAVCDRHGIVMVCDEIQTGFGRTGRLFAIEYEDVEPDIMTLAKGVAGGFGGLGGTYAGSPLGCAAGLAVMEVIEGEGLCDRAVEVGGRIRAGLEDLQRRYPDRIGDVRGKGAMIAMELVREGDPGQPDAELAKALVNTAKESGLLVLSCGTRGNVVRFLAPWTIPYEHLGEEMQILKDAFAATV